MENRKFKAIIFDLDGTLIDSLEDIADCANQVLTARGYPTYTIDSYRTFVGNGLLMLIKKMLPFETEEAVFHNCAREFKKIYEKNWNNKTSPYTGIPEMLNKLSTMKVKLSVLSNKPDSFTKECVKGFFPEYNFSPIYGHTENISPKPDPEGALLISENLGFLPAECIFVGDSDVDIKTGLAAGMSTVGVSWGFRSKKELFTVGAETVINHPLELVHYVRNI